jgi:hypothetical protein
MSCFISHVCVCVCVCVCVLARLRIHVYTQQHIRMAEDATAGAQALGRKSKPRTECKLATNFRQYWTCKPHGPIGMLNSSPKQFMRALNGTGISGNC